MQPCCVVWRAPSRAPWPWQCRWTISQDFERSARCSLQNECLHIRYGRNRLWPYMYIHGYIQIEKWLHKLHMICFPSCGTSCRTHVCTNANVFSCKNNLRLTVDCLIQWERETYTNKVALFTQWNWPALSGWQVNAIFLTVAPAFGQTEPHKLDNPHRKHYEVLRHKWDSMIQSSHLVP